MHEISKPRATDDDVRDVLGFVNGYDVESIHDLYADYLSDYRTGISESLDAVTTMTDAEALRHAGFDEPSFFYEVVWAYRIAILEYPARGGGFSCMPLP